MKNLKSTKGITLVALIITIIVLLILAMVSISLIMNGGIIDRAERGTAAYSVAEEKEQIQLGYKEYQMAQFQDANPQLQVTGATAVTPKNGGGWTVAFASGRSYDVAANGTITEGSGSSNSSTTYTAYAIGDEVTVGGEDFYVLEASDASQSTVTLLAKYNLNQAGTAQAPNAACFDTKCAFSSTNYWASAHAAYTDWSTKELDINEVSGEVSGDAIYKAKAYATSKGGTNGRLLTYEEADSLKTSYGDMIYGTANRQGEGSNEYYLIYWLSSAYEHIDDYVCFVIGDYSFFDSYFYLSAFDDYYDDDRSMGVRPVITVSKSLVS